jgi:hypothetical protein
MRRRRAWEVRGEPDKANVTERALFPGAGKRPYLADACD